MITTTGPVNWLKVNKDVANDADFGLFELTIGVGEHAFKEMFFVWFSLADPADSPPTATDWIARNMHIAMLRDAMAQKLPVTVTHEPNSNFYTSLQLGS